jgi:hypothetical protein
MIYQMIRWYVNNSNLLHVACFFGLGDDFFSSGGDDIYIYYHRSAYAYDWSNLSWANINIGAWLVGKHYCLEVLVYLAASSDWVVTFVFDRVDPVKWNVRHQNENHMGSRLQYDRS